MSPRDVDLWLERRTYYDTGLDAAQVADAKGTTTVTLLIPARDEERTIRQLVNAVRSHPPAVALLDAVVVVGGGSSDETKAEAERAGATVLGADDPRDDVAGRTVGKGGGVRHGLIRTSGDIVILVDRDLEQFDPQWVVALAAPLLADPSLHLVKGAPRRPLVSAGVTRPDLGGRVTELLARPLLNALWPALRGVAQPLAGEVAARRDLLEQLPLAPGYGLEIGMLIDAYRMVGLDALGQVVLGERRHRHHDDAALGEMASAVLQTALARSGWLDLPSELMQFARAADGRLVASTVDVTTRDLPPVASWRATPRVSS